MSYLRKIEYEIVLKDSFCIIRNCPKCGRKAHYINTKNFASMRLETYWISGLSINV